MTFRHERELQALERPSPPKPERKQTNEMTISRRVFVRAGALGLVSFGLDPLFLSRAAYATCRPTVLPSNNRSLVCLFQRGAVDGLSMLVPHGEESYYRERPRIAIPRTA